MALRGGKETPMDPASGAVVRDLADIEIGGAKHPAYFIHPPWRAGAGYVFWEAETAVPAGGGELRFYTGLSDKPPSKSDGVTFKVVVCEQGGSKEIFNYHHAERVWKEHAADLSAWSGRRTRLRFIADCGPKDNTTADQGAWACVGVATAGQAWRSPKTSRFMAWVGSEDTEASFYFRDLGPSRVDVRFEIEGAEPVVISGLTMHAHADAIAREFEHGVVLANPSDREYTFDLKKLFPGRQLRRLQGSPQQDLKTNDGQPAADRLTLAPRDAIFLRD
jgi:hypothetical protein